MTLPSAEEKSAVVEQMFDRIAERYDRMNRMMTFGLDRGWRRRTIALAKIREGDRVLDLGCGTGDLCDDARAAGADVTGVDYSAGMLGVAVRRGTPADLVRADGLALPFADASFDVVLSAFVLRNFTELAVAMTEAARVLRPGGRLAVLEVCTPANALLRTGHGFHFRYVVPLLGRLVGEPEAYAYLPESAAYLPDWPELAPLLTGAGFEAPATEKAALGAVQIITARAHSTPAPIADVPSAAVPGAVVAGAAAPSAEVPSAAIPSAEVAP